MRHLDKTLFTCTMLAGLTLGGCSSSPTTIGVNDTAMSDIATSLKLTNDLVDSELLGFTQFKVSDSQTVLLAKFINANNELCTQYVSGILSKFKDFTIVSTVAIDNYCEPITSSTASPKFQHLKQLRTLTFQGTSIQTPIFVIGDETFEGKTTGFQYDTN